MAVIMALTANQIDTSCVVQPSTTIAITAMAIQKIGKEKKLISINNTSFSR